MNPREKANYMLRRLEQFGWIYTETDYSYVQRVSFRDYAIVLIKSLISIEQERHTEYQGYIYTIYHLARATSSDHPGLALMQIMDNMDALSTGLKSLNANIKQYIDNLTKHSTVAEILDALLNDYYTNVVDKAYHRLLTSDNVSKFRPEIMDRLEANSRNARYVNAAAREIAELMETGEEEAREKALNIMHSVMDAFRQMDQILEEINKKNTRYQRAAINRAKFLLSSSEDIRGQLRDILSYMNEEIQRRALDYQSVYELEAAERLIRLFSWEYLDTDSLYSPVEGKKEFTPGKISIREVDPGERKRRQQEMLRKMQAVLSPVRINEYVFDRLGSRKSMRASEILLEDMDKAAGTGPGQGLPGGSGDGPENDPVMESFIRLIYIRLYGQRKNMKYTLQPGEMKCIAGYRFRDYVVEKKTGH